MMDTVYCQDLRTTTHCPAAGESYQAWPDTKSREHLGSGSVLFPGGTAFIDAWA